MGKKTPLYQKHLQAHAKMVDFAGWCLPLHYGSQLQEHLHVRRQAGMFDVSHMTVVDIIGQQAREFLRHLLANDVGRLKNDGQALYSCMLNEKGGVVDDLIVYHQSKEQFRLVTNAATREKNLAWMARHTQNFAVQLVERQDVAMLAVQGPQARECVKPLLPSELQATALALPPFYACWNEELFIARTGYTGEDGFEIILPASQVVTWWDRLIAQGVMPIGLGARDTLRLEAGLNLYGTDMDENTTPLESGLGWTVAWVPEDRVFIGRNALEIQRKAPPHTMMKGLVLLEKGVLRSHQTVIVEGFGEGQITSGSFSPILEKSIALARLPIGNYEQATVMVRNKPLAVRIVKPPFVRQGKVSI